MAISAMHLTPSCAVVLIDLHPNDGSEAIHELLGGDTVDRGVYHRRALMHIQGNVTGQLSINLPAWTLASTWRRAPLPYSFYGPVVLTGPDGDSGLEPLTHELEEQVRKTVDLVRMSIERWRRRPPVSNEAALQGLLSDAQWLVVPGE